jgi:hypothetical protein
MGVLAGLCFVIGLAPMVVAPMLEIGIEAWAPHVTDVGGHLAERVPLQWISIMGCGLVAGLWLAWSVLSFRLRAGSVERGATWGCGYTAPNTRMQYTSSSFGQMVVELFAWALRPRTLRPPHLPLFPQRSEFRCDVPDAVLDEAVLPTFGLVARLFSWLRILQQGNIQIYLLYIFLVLVALLLWR